MTINLPYGREGLKLDLPEGTDILRCAPVAGLSDERASLVQALREPIGSPPLRMLAKPGDKVVLVHSDITRATPNERLLPVILEELEAAGVHRQDIVLLNGLGTHRPQTQAELRKMLGDAVVDRYRCEQHDGNDDARLVSLGTTSLGNPVRVNRLLLESDVRILTGFIEPHFFAGFSGGPKAVLPALAGAESVQTNHSFAMIGHPLATWGVTRGNPLWEEICEVALRVKPTFLVNVTMNALKQITGVFAGDMLAAHQAGCEFVRSSAMLKVDQPYDVAITTNGGYPLDQNLYQTIKGISAASRVVRDGGTILLCAGCEDGLPDHGGYAKLLAKAGSPTRALELLAQPDFSEPDQWAVQIQCQILLKQDVFVHSVGLSPEQITEALYQPCGDPLALLARLRLAKPDLRVCVLPEGPQTIGYLALDIEDPASLRAYLQDKRLVDPDETLKMRVLAGGVSNRTVWLGRPGGEAWVIKQALGKLRVKSDWFSDPKRIHQEALGLKWLGQLLPQGSVPKLVLEDRSVDVLAMEAVPEPHQNWKTLLLAGELDLDLVRQHGTLLAQLERAPGQQAPLLAAEFADRSYFETLRVEAYYLYSAQTCAAAREFLSALVQETRATTVALTHGDYSPKNALVYQNRLVLLDHEVMHFGDPAFDLGFALTHLLSKANHLVGLRSAFAEAAATFWRAYLQEVGQPAWFRGLEARAVRHTLACLLARVCGKSPLEYLSPHEGERQLKVVLGLLQAPPVTVPELVEVFVRRIAECP